MCKSYQGCTNYPTYVVLLWLANDYGLYRRFMLIVEELRVRETKGCKFMLADEIKEYVQSNNPLSSDTSMCSDMLAWAMGMVDWEEVAGTFLED